MTNSKFSRKKTTGEIEKIRNAQLGKPRPLTTGNKNGMWKGEKAKYPAVHQWVISHFEKPSFCELCLNPIDKRRGYSHWSCRTHNYILRTRDNWMLVCVKCHSFYDKTNLGKKFHTFGNENPNNTDKNRQCSTCHKTLPLTSEYFHKSNGHTLGFKYVCKNCRSLKNLVKTFR